MDASFYKPFSQSECRDNKKSCHLLEKKGTHPMRMHVNNTTYNRSNQNAGFLDTTNTTCNRSNQNAGFLDTTNTTCNRSNQNASFPDTHAHPLNQSASSRSRHNKTTCYGSATQCWKAFLVVLMKFSCYNRTEVCTATLSKGLMTYFLNHPNPAEVFFLCVCVENFPVSCQ